MEQDMSGFDLPAITPDAHPEFTDGKSCSEWLRSLPLANVAPSHGRLLGQTEELNCFDVTPAERLRILELLIEPIGFVQIEHAKKFANKPVPLTRVEREIFLSVVALWDGLAHGYQRCLQALADGAPGVSGQSALVCQRALWCAGQRMAEHYKAYQEIGGEDWRLLHRIYAIAEGRGETGKEVSGPAQDGRNTTCRETYATTLLLHLANDPSENSPKQMAMVSRWLDRWTQKVGIGDKPPVSELGLALLAVDLAAAAGPRHAALSGASVRFLELEEVAKDIRSRVTLLRKGETPESLGLGEEVNATAAEQLLLVLHRIWCEEPKQRASARRAVTAQAQVCAGLPAQHYYVSGKPFRQPGEAKELTKAQREEIATFGRVATRQEDEYSQLKGYSLEIWTLREESLGGLRIERAEDGGSGRYAKYQLIAVRPSDAKSFMIGVVRWLSVSANFDLRAGVRVLPGVPQGIAIRPTGLNAMSEKYVQALLLPAVAALQSPATLILPAGWYRPKRVIEVHSDKAEQLLLTGLVDRGVDFERVSFGVP